MWEYKEAGRLITLNSVGAENCIYCQSPMLRFPAEKFEVNERRLLIQLSICHSCGWWAVYRVHQGEYPRTSGIVEGYSGAIRCLKELDLTNVDAPLSEVRQYLLAKQDSVFKIHSKLFEDVVCSVFKNFGWQARVTAYSGDDGIDVILDGSADSSIGVQVKRYGKQRPIKAEQIRSLAGALLVNGYTKGVFVTTTSFRKGAVKAAAKFASIGYPIELIGADRFLEELGIAQSKSFQINNKQVESYVLSPGVHIGSGLEKAFMPGENLLDRQIAIQTWLSSDLIDLGDEDCQ